AADAIDIDVVAHDVRDVDRHFLVREGRKADAAAAIDHADRIVHGAGRGRAFDDVVDALAAIELLHLGHDVGRFTNVDDMVGTEFEPYFQAVVTRAGEDYR